MERKLSGGSPPCRARALMLRSRKSTPVCSQKAARLLLLRLALPAALPPLPLLAAMPLLPPPWRPAPSCPVPASAAHTACCEQRRASACCSSGRWSCWKVGRWLRDLQQEGQQTDLVHPLWKVWTSVYSWTSVYRRLTSLRKTCPLHAHGLKQCLPFTRTRGGRQLPRRACTRPSPPATCAAASAAPRRRTARAGGEGRAPAQGVQGGRGCMCEGGVNFTLPMAAFVPGLWAADSGAAGAC